MYVVRGGFGLDWGPRSVGIPVWMSGGMGRGGERLIGMETDGLSLNG